MIQIVVDESVKKQFLDADGPCVVFDAAGNKLGQFTPAYAGYESPLSADELDQIEIEGRGRPLQDILRDLERQA